MLAEGLLMSEKLTVLYECVAVELHIVSVSLRQALPATASRTTMDNVRGWYDRRTEPLLNQVRVLHELVQTLNARLTLL